MGVELSDQEKAKAIVQELVRARKLGPAPDGPIIERFDPLALAQIIEMELTRCARLDLPKLSIHMDTLDAQLLASALRKLAILGV